jgi:hypothetical protein
MQAADGPPAPWLTCCPGLHLGQAYPWARSERSTYCMMPP